MGDREHKRTGTDLALLRQRLRHVDRLCMAGQLVSFLAHKLGTPLNVVAGRASLIQLSAGDAESKEHGVRIGAQAQRMAEILREWVDGLDRSLLEAPKQAFQCSTTLVDDAMALCADLAAARNVTLRVGESSNVVVRMNPDVTLQALDDLLVHAISAADPGATIVLHCTTGRIEAPPDYHAAGGDYACFGVENSSAAFSADDEDEPQMLWASVDAQSQGNLEIALARHLVRSEGGWVEVSRGPVSGTCAKVYAPCAVVDEAPGGIGGSVT